MKHQTGFKSKNTPSPFKKAVDAALAAKNRTRQWLYKQGINKGWLWELDYGKRTPSRETVNYIMGLLNLSLKEKRVFRCHAKCCQKCGSPLSKKVDHAHGGRA